jgi:GNAT superfamily N-acetyltransferase
MNRSLDPGLIEILEGCELAAWGDFFRSASADTAAICGLQVAQHGGGLITSAARSDALALNRVGSLGVDRPADPADVEEIIQLFAAAQVSRFFVQLSPAARQPDLREQLEAKGLRHYNNWMKLFRDTSPPPTARTDLEIRPVGGEHARQFGELVIRNFNWPESFEEWVAGLVARDGWRLYLAFDGARAVASGALFADGSRAWLDFATTDPEYRGRGAQSALLARRINDAAELGCDLLVVETAEDRPEKPAPSFRNQLRFGFEVAYARPNYIYEMKG